MQQHNNNVRQQLYENLVGTVRRFGEILSVDDQAVPTIFRQQALLRRLSIGFIVLFEYLKEISALPEEDASKPLDELSDYFILKGVLEKEDKEKMLVLGSMYMAIRWPEPGNFPNEEKIMQDVQEIYEFLEKTVKAQEGEFLATDISAAAPTSPEGSGQGAPEESSEGS